jgi:hypothetical protein
MSTLHAAEGPRIFIVTDLEWDSFDQARGDWTKDWPVCQAAEILGDQVDDVVANTLDFLRCMQWERWSWVPFG